MRLDADCQDQKKIRPGSTHHRKKLSIPEDGEYEIAIALGYKAVTKEPHTYTYERQVTIVE